MSGKGLQWARIQRTAGGVRRPSSCFSPKAPSSSQSCGRSILSAPNPHIWATMTSSRLGGCLPPEAPTSCTLLNPQRVRPRVPAAAHRQPDLTGWSWITGPSARNSPPRSVWWLRVHREGRRQGRGAKESQDPEITWSGCTESQTWWEGLGHRLQVGEWEPGCLLPDVGCVTSPRHPERAGWVPMGSLGAPIRSGRLCVCVQSVYCSLPGQNLALEASLPSLWCWSKAQSGKIGKATWQSPAGRVTEGLDISPFPPT